MKTPPNIKRDTVKSLADQGFDFFVPIKVLKEVDTTTEEVFVKVTAIQLSKAVLRANTKDIVIVDAKFGRNGSKTAVVVETPCF